ncbi:uncharacterized protein LOC143305550 [Osmia lignaria lignaria]|uniref:uncharacterized protein LOC143305550 n=1 Tax=Osmia lignaria lignaria TaxID=1437193 RepID=UPI00402B121E
MGFKWRKTNNIRKVLIEKPSIVTWRARYLSDIEYYRQQNRNIVYIDETWVDNTLCFSKCWQSEEILGITRSTSSSHRLIIVHAGGKDGFIKGTELIFKPRTTTGDYHGEMNASNFEKWINEKLIPNLPTKSVVVMDNAPYHSVQINKPPSTYSKKQEMILWLVTNNIPHTPEMRKHQLLELIKKNKNPEKMFKVDETLKSHGHSVLRLPPYMCELNPMELAWSKVKRKIRERNTSLLSSNELRMYAEEAVNEVTSADWHNFCKHTEKIEAEYWQKDGLVEEVIEVIDLHPEGLETDSDDSTSED